VLQKWLLKAMLEDILGQLCTTGCTRGRAVEKKKGALLGAAVGAALNKLLDTNGSCVWGTKLENMGVVRKRLMWGVMLLEALLGELTAVEIWGRCLVG
jgi:hypothetical protein